jgi:hypothetical protein
MERMIFDTPRFVRLSTILKEVKSGKIVIPYFARPFYWSNKKRLDLLNSIICGWPIGNLIVWRTNKVVDQISVIDYVSLGQNKDYCPEYLVDGFQRIFMLFSALYSSNSKIYYEFGLEKRNHLHWSRVFHVVESDNVPDTYLPLNLLLDSCKLYDFTIKFRNSGRADLQREAERLSNVFYDYTIPILNVVTDDGNLVQNIVYRINGK